MPIGSGDKDSQRGKVMDARRFTTSAIAAAVAAAATLPAFAGVKYWDNPDFKAFDVGDYVQDGLVVNYDGIRNAGPDAPHDFSAMTWVNCADPGHYDMERHSTNGTKDNSNAATASAWNEDDSHGAWTDRGFIFDKQSAFHQPATITIPASYSMQVLLDAKSSDQAGIGYIMCGENATKWGNASLAMRDNNSIANTFYFNAMGAGGTSRPAISGGTYAYGTAILDKTNAVLFAGISAPWNAAASGGTSGHYMNSSYTPATTQLPKGFSLGGHYPRTDEMFKGTIKFYRLYNRVLADEEVAWNRVVDEARFFGRRAAIPVTNVVVATTIPGIEYDHFALDAEGCTFTAPVQRTVKGSRYLLNGYTLETWNGSGWGNPTEYDGDSCTLSNTTGKVRLTWNYKHPVGEGRLVVFDESDYVTGGLEVFLDGIRNIGSDADHDPTATTWVNLGSSGATGNGVLTKGGDGDQGHWTDDGYSFAGLSKFIANLTYTKTYTVQILTDMVQNNQYDPSATTIYLFSGAQARFALATYNQYVYLRTQNNGNDGDLRFTIDKSKPIGFITAMQDNDGNWASVFPGTQMPTPRTYDGDMDNLTLSSIAIGGWGGGTGQFMKGTIKSFRYYPDKILTQDELEKNRKVDNYRFFGILPETDVIVASTYSYLHGNEADGPYDVDGSYTFTAPATVTAPNGIEYACDGYIVERKSGQVGWVVIAEGSGNAYAYSTTAGTVRLTWKWRATHGLRTAADYESAAKYDFTDYSQAGLRLHYDGLLNQGVDARRDTTATKWVNLGSDGAAMNLTLSRHSSDNNQSAWGEQGYDFAGHAQFQSSAIMWTTNNFTAQAFVDAALNDHLSEPGNYIAATDWTRLGLQAYGYGNAVRLNALGERYMDPRPRFTPENGRLQYVTAIQNDTAKTTTIFPGTSAPTNGTATTGFRQYTACSNEYTVAFRLGGWGGGANTDQCLVGTMNNFRYYDRVLTEEELIRNRNVDAIRYFGELGVTNLVVAIQKGADMNCDPPEGAYYVEGSWTFGATPGANTPTHYRLEDLDEATGKWINPRIVSGTTFEYDATQATAATMKLTWCRTKALMLIVR